DLRARVRGGSRDMGGIWPRAPPFPARSRQGAAVQRRDGGAPRREHPADGRRMTAGCLRSAGEAAGIEESLLLHRRRAPQKGVAMRKAAEAGDDVAMVPGMLQSVRILALLEERDTTIVRREILAMHERHVEEELKALVDAGIVTVRDGALGNGKR